MLNSFFQTFSILLFLKRYLPIFICINLLLWCGYSAEKCWLSDSPQANQATLVRKLSMLCWIGYSPSHFDPGRGLYPSRDDIRSDLRILKESGFTGIVTYGSEKSLGQVPAIAQELGFSGIIMGVWDPQSEEEINHAISMQEFVDGYCVGNGGLNKYYSTKSLRDTIESLRSITEKPVTTSEGIDLYFRNDLLFELGDWVFPDSRLYWNPGKNRQPEYFMNILVEEYTQLLSLTEKPVMIKAVGLPTGGAEGATVQNQLKFFSLLLKNSTMFPYERVRFIYFEAFDQPWKNWHKVEPHWGLFHNDRSPKPAVQTVWGRNIRMAPRAGVAENTYEATDLHPKWFFLFGNMALLTFIGYRRLTRGKKRRKTLKIQLQDNTLLWCDTTTSLEITFSKTHNKCLLLLATFLQHDRPLTCGELIQQTKDSALTGKCLYFSSGDCNEKKQYCQAYRTLNTHRIGPIRKLLRKYAIGDILVTPGKSEWRVMIHKDITVQVKT